MNLQVVARYDHGERIVPLTTAELRKDAQAHPRGGLRLTAKQARAAHAARVDAVRALDRVLDGLLAGKHDALIEKYFDVPATQGWRSRLHGAYLKIRTFLAGFNESGFAYVPRSEEGADDDFYAAVNTRDSKTIFLGTRFFLAPPGRGRDSRPGILIHEAAHLVLGVKDHAYGQVVSDLPAAQAIDNGDTYEYFIEDAAWRHRYGALAGGASRANSLQTGLVPPREQPTCEALRLRRCAESRPSRSAHVTPCAWPAQALAGDSDASGCHAELLLAS